MAARFRYVLVLDDPLPFAAVRGRALMLSRGAFDHAVLEPLLAHEAHHVDSLDSRLALALSRLMPLKSQIGVLDFGGSSTSGLVFGLSSFAMKAAIWVVLCGPVLRFSRGVWGMYWRRREYAADAYAVELGQGYELISLLETYVQPFDLPVPYLVFDKKDHEFAALRIDRLQRLLRRS